MRYGFNVSSNSNSFGKSLCSVGHSLYSLQGFGEVHAISKGKTSFWA